MAAITTSVSDVQDWLADTIAQALDSAEVPVALGTPHPDGITGPARVWLPLNDGNASHSQTYTLTSLTAKSETYEQPVIVFVQTLTTDVLDARARLDSIVDPILAAISGDPTAGGLVELVQATQVVREEAQPDRNVRQMAATITVRVRAWLTA